MFKKSTIAFLSLIFTFVTLSTVLADADNKQTEGISLLRVSIWPKTLSWPKTEQINGLSIGLPSSYGMPPVNGVDFSFIWGDSQVVNGFKTAPVSTGAYFEGVQFAVISNTDDVRGIDFAIINYSESMRGIQFAIYNDTETLKGVQFGIVNHTGTIGKGVQFGIINIMENGFLPIFPFINFNVD